MLVYKVTNKINGKSYIGQTTGSLRKRWNEHCRSSSHCVVLSNAIQKYGKESFSIELLNRFNSLHDLNEAESEYIILFNTLAPNGYNLRKGGDNSLHSTESKQKISNAKRGKKFSLAHRKALSDAKQGTTLSKTHKARIAASCGSGPAHKDYGKTLSVEHKAKLSSSRKDKRKVICAKTGTVYDSVSSAALALGVSRRTISRMRQAGKL